MSCIRRLAALALLLALAPGVAAGDDGFGRRGFYVGVGGAAGIDFFEDDIEDAFGGINLGVDVDTSPAVNARAGYRIASWFALEAMYEWLDEFKVELDSIGMGGPGVAVGATLLDYTTHTITLNAKLIIPTWRIQPYLLLGLGAQRFIADSDIPGLGGFDLSEKGWAFAGRPGAGVDLYITKNFLVNVEVSGVLATTGIDTIPSLGDFFYLSVGGGIQYRF